MAAASSGVEAKGSLAGHPPPDADRWVANTPAPLSRARHIRRPSLNLERTATPSGVKDRATRRPHLNLQPRMLTAQQAAEYLGYNSTDMLRRIPVEPVRLVPVNGQPRWDRRQLDLWLDGLSGLASVAANDDADSEDDVEISAWLARHGS